jgi:hypothetical protein
MFRLERSIFVFYGDLIGAQPVRPSGTRARIAALGMAVIAVPVMLGLFAALTALVIGDEAVALPLGVLMALFWTAATLSPLSALLSDSERNRILIALGAGVMTIVSIIGWVTVMFG